MSVDCGDGMEAYMYLSMFIVELADLHVQNDHDRTKGKREEDTPMVMANANFHTHYGRLTATLRTCAPCTRFTCLRQYFPNLDETIVKK